MFIWFLVSISAVSVILGQGFLLYLSLKALADVENGRTNVEGEKVELERDRLNLEKKKQANDIKALELMTKATPPDSESVEISSASDMAEYVDSMVKERNKG